MMELKEEYGSDLAFDRAVHLHDEDAWNEIEISFCGVIVGSELVRKEFVRENINTYFKNRRNKDGEE